VVVLQAQRLIAVVRLGEEDDGAYEGQFVLCGVVSSAYPAPRPSAGRSESPDSIVGAGSLQPVAPSARA
jgi:hypothetical protein